MNIKRNIIFALETRKRNGIPIIDNVPIRMRVSYTRQRIEFSTGYRIDTSKWDADKQRVRNGCTNKLKQTASEINLDLNRYYSALQAIFKEFEVQEVIPTPDQLKAAFNARCSNDSHALSQTAFFPAFDEFTQEEGSLNSWTNSTYIKFRTIRNHFMEFDPALSFEFFDESGLAKFVTFLRDRKGMRNSTVLKDLAFVKWFLRWAYRKGYTTNNACDQFNPGLRTTRKKVIFLTPDELNKIRNYTIPSTKQYLERVRDVFLFCCFTGLRHSDVYNLKRSDVKDNHIEVTTVKTADSLVIELNDHSRTILEKYKDIAFMGGKVLPVVSNQKMNLYLKELCQLAGIDEPIRETYYRGNERIEEVLPKYELVGTHVGRRTFICNALSLGIPTQVVMKWTGHNDYKAMKPYIDIADKIKSDAMSKFNNL
ncbi:site-specific integrase [uncultured Alistipes sp.]|uniref:site-specific integrase n=1 Tax=uncultured Alistipes sp. TaxID=538949 RepID=UPI0026220A0A|nr:site-specific integrase [uncultured Alistipes sp.]